MSIKARLLLTISIVIAVAFLVIGVVIVGATENRMIARVDAGLRASPLQLPRSNGGDGRFGRFDASRRANAILVLDERANVRVAEPAGYVSDPDPLPALTLNDLLAHRREIYTAHAVDGSRKRYRVLVRPLNDGFLVQAAPLDDVDATVRNLIRIVALAGIFVLGAVTLAVWLTIRRGLRPIDDMIGTAGLIAAGDLSHRIEHTSTTSEVGRLGRAINSMLGQIESSFATSQASEARLRRFVADASHELRTPLTSIRGYAELFRGGVAADPATLERVMLRIESEGTRMSKLVEDLLLLARLDQGRPLDRVPVDLVPLIDDIVTDARVIDPARPIGFTYPPQALVAGDPDQLRQVVANLVTNARVHTNPATPIRVALETESDTVRVVVADDGPGIAPEDAARAFDRFFRVDVSRSRSSGGSGLGLAIVASIVEAHDGHIALDTAPDRGTTVTVSLPRVMAGGIEPRTPSAV